MAENATVFMHFSPFEDVCVCVRCVFLNLIRKLESLSWRVTTYKVEPPNDSQVVEHNPNFAMGF